MRSSEQEGHVHIAPRKPKQCKKYTPDKGWLVLELVSIENYVHYRIFAVWSLGQWRLSSGSDSLYSIQYHSNGSIEWPQDNSVYFLQKSLLGRLSRDDLKPLNSCIKELLNVFSKIRVVDVLEIYDRS